MGLLEPGDWEARWISYRDPSPLHTSRENLYLPAPRHYRKEFTAAPNIRRATVHASALGIFELHLNGQRIGDAWFEPGWADYHRRAHYRTHDVTPLVRAGANRIGAIVAEGWYSGYVGYGLLVGYGPHRAGRCFYGKTPALLAQLEIEYTDGSRLMVATDKSWEVTSDGPIREADLIMGETHDARREDPDWCQPSGSAASARKPDPSWRWEPAIPAEANGSTKALFSDNTGSREVELGFRPPARLQAYAAPPIRVTQELPAIRLTEPKPGVHVFDLGQNFAGVARLRLQGPAGTRVQLRYGEMLHPDGSLMTENLRRARATDSYTLRGDPAGEVWQPRFTYHGFQYLELTGVATKPALETITGLVLHNDTPLVGEFACADAVLTRFWKNTQWTQRANFIEIPTDCPQRDERLGWMGDAQVYVRAATYNADVAAFFTKWLDDVDEAQRDFGAYPDYCPYPMGHGTPRKTFGTAWTDAGIICPWTIWQVYGDTRVIDRHWASMTRFMEWRAATTTPEGLGVSIGNPWGDWLNVNESTPIEYIDTCYHALTCRMMAEMAGATGRKVEADNYRARREAVCAAFAKAYWTKDSTLAVDTQTAHVLALWAEMLPEAARPRIADRLAAKIEAAGGRMATGFLGTKPLLPMLTANGHHDLAVRLFQSRQFPSWGYEVVNGANSVWERWDSYTREHGFNGLAGNQNASMNSFSHYSFGAVTEWMFRDLAGMDTDGPGYRRLRLRPAPPARGRRAEGAPPLDWVKASYGSPRGPITMEWRRNGATFSCAIDIPANTSAALVLPAKTGTVVREGEQALEHAKGVRLLEHQPHRVVLDLESGRYRFETELPAADQ